MYPYLTQALAAERIKDMHEQAAQHRLAGLARPGRRVERVSLNTETQPVLVPSHRRAEELLSDAGDRQPTAVSQPTAGPESDDRQPADRQPVGCRAA